jgi:hypothetical protein
MKKRLRSTALGALIAISCAATIQAQDQPGVGVGVGAGVGAGPGPTAKLSMTPLKVTITISRYQGEKKIGSLPYTLSVSMDPARGSNSRSLTNLRNGTRVPITSTTTDKNGTPPTISYQDVGTSIDCYVSPPDETGRFKLEITIDESSVYEDAATKTGVQIMGRPTLRSFRTTGSLMLKDGQSAEMSNTPDKMAGETVRVDVALVVVK